MSGYAYPEVLVDPQWVADHLGDPNLRVVESNLDRSAYDSGHIPGAVAWTWNEDFQHPTRKDVPDKEGFEALLSRSGIADDTTVVLYGTPSNWYATFAIWLLKIYGHGDARVMTGGRKKWVDEGRPMTTEEPRIAPTSYTAEEPDWSIRALRDLVHGSVIPCCVIGGRSNQTWFVLKYLLGYPKVRLYDGSWLEWGGLIGVPIER